MPAVSDGGRTYTIKVKPGIYFASDPAFKGKRRELTADDYVYSIKRIFDPKIRSYWLYVFDHRLVGLDEALARARKTGHFDYDAPIEGLQTIDRYTLRLRFKEPNYTFSHWLADAALSAVAREVVEAHADSSNRVMEHPVGTGPYRLKEWVRGQKIVLEANPDFRDQTYPVPGEGSEPGDAAIAKDNAGKKLPIVGRIEVIVIEEEQPRLLAFDSGQLDLLELPRALADNVLDKGRLRPEYAKRGVKLHRQTEPSLSFVFFNMDDPVVGGYTPEKIALRRAMIMGYDRRAEIEVLRHGQAEPASQLVPPGLAGHDPTLQRQRPYDPAGARALLDKFGYKDRDGDGYRETPDGKPLVITKANTPAAIDRVDNELWKKCMDAIGIRISVFHAEMAGAQQDVGSRPAADVGTVVDFEFAGRRRFREPAVQQEHRHVERRALPAAGLRSRLRGIAQSSRRTGANGALPLDDRSGAQLRAVDDGPERLRQRAGAAVAQGLQAEPFPAQSVEVLRRRPAPLGARAAESLANDQRLPGTAANSAFVYSCRGRANTSATGPYSTMRPRCITATRSQTCAATRRSCVMNSIARSSRCRISSSSASTCACTETSSADTASSAISRSGSIASARAMQMRWRWPPENWCG